MDPENVPTTPSNAPAADAQQPPAATAPASYTEADLAAAVQRARDAAYADARRMYAGKLKESPRPAEPRNDQPTAPRQETDVAALVKAEAAKIRATERALSAFDLTDAARSILEADLDAANPADPSAWIAQRAEAFGLPRRGSAPQNAVTVTNNTSPAPTAPPAPMPGAPPASPRITSDTPILQLAKRDPAALAELQRTNPAEFMRRLLDEMRSTRVPIYRG